MADIQEILDTESIDSSFNEEGEFRGPRENMAATVGPDENAKIEFYVQMRSWTQRDMEALIVEAAARQIVGRIGESKLTKMIEERCMALVTQKIDAHLAKVTDAIIDQPLTPAFGDKKPVTMREFIGLYPREYLEQHIGSDGKPTQPSSYNNTRTRAEAFVSKFMDSKFKNDIEKATNTAIMEIRQAVDARHKAILAAEKQRFAEALAKVVSP
ncbi:hypothetical protein [Labrys neptuniae]